MDTPALDASVRYYQKLLISQYRNMTKAQLTIAILVKQALCDMMATYLQTAFDLETAIGAQLDVMGKYLGITRNIGPGAAEPWFGLQNYNGTGNPIGMTRYAGGSNTEGLWLRYAQAGANNAALPDTSFRLACMVRICQLYNTGSMGSIDAYLQMFWPGRQVVASDVHNHNIEYFVPAAFPLPLTVWEMFLPRPLGMSITVATY